MLTPQPEVFYQRKQELPLDELSRQGVKMYALAKRLKNVVWVDSSGNIEQSRREMLGVVLEAFWRRLG